MKKTFIFLLCSMTSAHAEIIFEPGAPDPLIACMHSAQQAARMAEAPHDQAWSRAMRDGDYKTANREAEEGKNAHIAAFNAAIALCKDVYRNVTK